MTRIPKHCFVAMAAWKEGSIYDTVSDYILGYFSNFTPETFTIDGKHQCHEGARRSFYDLYYLALTKFPELTLEDFAKTIINLMGVKYKDYEGETKIFNAIFCPDIHKIVFTPKCTYVPTTSYWRPYEYGYILGDGVEDGQDYDREGEDKLTFNAILELAGIESEEEYLKKVENNLKHKKVWAPKQGYMEH